MHALTNAIATTQANASSPQGFGGVATILLAIWCYQSRKNAIGGWLMLFQTQIYIGALVTCYSIYTLWNGFLPSTWRGDGRYTAYLIATIPSFLMVFVNAATAFLLFRYRTWNLVRILRVLLAVHLMFVLVRVAIDVALFKDDSIFAIIQAIGLCIWLPYLFLSKRVNAVFNTHTFQDASGWMHPNAKSAQKLFGRAYALEKNGRTKEALALYEALHLKFPNSEGGNAAKLCADALKKKLETGLVT
jgi:hypothetical protein